LAEVADKRIHGTTKKTPLELNAQEMPHLLAPPSLQFDTAQLPAIFGKDASKHLQSQMKQACWRAACTSI